MSFLKDNLDDEDSSLGQVKNSNYMVGQLGVLVSCSYRVCQGSVILFFDFLVF